MTAPNDNLQGGIIGKIRELSRFARQSQVVSGVGYRVRQTTQGTILDIDQSGGGAGGWRWAADKEWDYETAYVADEVVMVSPGNANEFGVVSGTKLIRAGIYVCVKSTEASTIAQCPCWPMINNDPSSTDNYWILISLYPTLMTYCVDGAATDYYVNAQPKVDPTP